MNTDEKDKKTALVNQVTERVIGAAFEVSNQLGCGFLEKVYENALCHELKKRGLDAQQQMPIHVWYDEILVGEYVADAVVEGRVLVELKAMRGLDEVHAAQCLNYLRATGLAVCLLFNFGRPKLEIKRFSL